MPFTARALLLSVSLVVYASDSAASSRRRLSSQHPSKAEAAVWREYKVALQREARAVSEQGQ